MRLSKWGALVAAVCAPAGVSIALGATAAPGPAVLTFVGKHVEDANLPAGLRHEGTFTAEPPFCASGTAVDVRQPRLLPLNVERRYTCDDGTGTFTALMEDASTEHGLEQSPLGPRPWKILEGTGRYASLRGKGTYRGEFVSGNRAGAGTGDRQAILGMVYRSTWSGVVDFDATPPSANLPSATVKKLKPRGRYALRLVLDVRDNTAENAVSYSVVVWSGRTLLGSKKGETMRGTAVVSFRIRPPARSRTLRIELNVADPLGNEASGQRVVTFKR